MCVCGRLHESKEEHRRATERLSAAQVQVNIHVCKMICLLRTAGECSRLLKTTWLPADVHNTSYAQEATPALPDYAV